MLSLRQIRSFVAVVEEGSFTRAAQRENATQSGISQHVAALEERLGATLIERASGGVTPTPAGRAFYGHALAALRSLDAGRAEVAARAGVLDGEVRAGLMPSFTRAAAAPALAAFLERYPHVPVEIVEGYSGALSDMVRAGTLDFAAVPAGSNTQGLRVTPLARDREMLVSNPARGLAHRSPVALAELGPLKMIVPGRANIRRQRLEEYFATNGVVIERLLEMDAMFATLELVACSDWVTVLPGVICVGDADGRARHVNALHEPALHSEFVVVEPARRALNPAAEAFLTTLRAEIDRLIAEFAVAG